MKKQQMPTERERIQQIKDVYRNIVKQKGQKRKGGGHKLKKQNKQLSLLTIIIIHR